MKQIRDSSRLVMDLQDGIRFPMGGFMDQLVILAQPGTLDLLGAPALLGRQALQVILGLLVILDLLGAPALLGTPALLATEVLLARQARRASKPTISSMAAHPLQTIRMGPHLTAAVQESLEILALLAHTMVQILFYSCGTEQHQTGFQ